MLEREGELVRVSAEVDPDLEITEINDSVVKSGACAPVRKRKGVVTSAADQPVRDGAPHVPRFRRVLARQVGRKLGDELEMQPPEGLVAKVKGPPEAEVDCRLAAEDGAGAGRCMRSSSPAPWRLRYVSDEQRPTGSGPLSQLPALFTESRS
jgi:3-octaprenyl-4-hydroxybenzoate carboxy-lyase N-terminal domain